MEVDSLDSNLIYIREGRLCLPSFKFKNQPKTRTWHYKIKEKHHDRVIIKTGLWVSYK